MARSPVPRWVTIIQGDPDPAGDRLCHALADAYALGAVGGHEVMRIEVARLDPILCTNEEFETGRLPESLVEAQNAIVSAHPYLPRRRPDQSLCMLHGFQKANVAFGQPMGPCALAN